MKMNIWKKYKTNQKSMNDIVSIVAITWLTITNIYTLNVLFRNMLLTKSKDIQEYNKVIEKKKEDPKELPNIVEVPMYNTN